jgi:hypothetical protein
MSRSVGPGRPPKGSRFRKGESGNPKGRPRKPKRRASVFEILFDRRIPLMQQNGQQRDLTVEEALQLRTYQDAVAGKRSAIRDVLKWIMEREKWFAKRAPRQPIVQLIEHDPDNANEALLLLGIAERDTRYDYPHTDNDRLLLQPWATQKALSRPGRRRLTKDQISEIKRCTRDPETLRWPASVGEEDRE